MIAVHDSGEMPLRIAILGAGISGLAAAYYLKKESARRARPIELKVFEASNRAGGRMLSFKKHEIVLEAGPDSLFTQQNDCYELSIEIGLRNQMIFPGGDSFAILRNKTLMPVPSGMLLPFPRNISALLRHPELSFADRLGAVCGGFKANDFSADDVSIADFMEARFGKNVGKRALEPLLTGVYGAPAHELSMAFLQSELWKNRSQLLTHSLRGLLRRKKKLPPYFNFNEGIDTLPRKLQRYLAPQELFLQRPVESLEKRSAGYCIHSQGMQYDCDAVVSALPLEILLKVISAPLELAYARLNSYPYGSTTIVNLLLERDSFQVPTGLTGFLIPEAQPNDGVSYPAASAVSFMSAKWPGRESNKMYYLRVFYRDSAHSTWSEQNDSQIINQALNDLKAALGLGKNPALAFGAVHRWAQAAPLYGIGYASALENFDKGLSREFPGLFALGPIRSSGIPGCVAAAKRMSKRLFVN
jgi:oxygen-dependent protoporphyrinogen oxidase